MTGHHQHNGHTQPDRAVTGITRPPNEVPVVQLACTSCQLVYEPDTTDFGTGHTACPRCGGWTWIAQLATTPGDVGGVQ